MAQKRYLLWSTRTRAFQGLIHFWVYPPKNVANGFIHCHNCGERANNVGRRCSISIKFRHQNKKEYEPNKRLVKSGKLFFFNHSTGEWQEQNKIFGMFRKNKEISIQRDKCSFSFSEVNPTVCFTDLGMLNLPMVVWF